MSAHNNPIEAHDAPVETISSTNAETLTVSKSPQVFNLRSDGAETRTLALPTKAGARVRLHFQTDGGDITVTVASAYNEVGSTTMVFANVGEFAVLEAYQTAAGVFFWRLLSNSNIGNNAIVTQGAALTAQLTAITITDAVGTPDYALSALTVTTPYGLATLAEMVTLLYVIQNLQVRLAEVEARLEAAGIVAAN